MSGLVAFPCRMALLVASVTAMNTTLNASSGKENLWKMDQIKSSKPAICSMEEGSAAKGEVTRVKSNALIALIGIEILGDFGFVIGF